MTEETPLDRAHAAMEASPEDPAPRLRFYDRLAESELFVLLEGEPVGEAVTPRIFPLDEEGIVLAFDREERLTAFTGAPAAYAALSGRALAGLLAGQGLGLGLNLEVAPSSIILPSAAIGWLAETLGQGPCEASERPEAFHAPRGLPEALVAALADKLATATGLARAAWLAGVTYAGGRRGHVLAFVGAVQGAEAALAQAIAETLALSGLDAAELDVTFLAPSDPAAATLARCGLRFDIPEPPRPAQAGPSAPGTDPDRPPRLR